MVVTVSPLMCRFTVVIKTLRGRRFVTITLVLWAAVVNETLRDWAAVVTKALSFRLRILVGDGGQSFLLDVSIRVMEAVFSLVERAQFRQTAGWRGQRIRIIDKYI